MSFQYLLDTNIFLEANKFHYPMDIFPAFWEWLDHENNIGKIASIMPVYVEMKDYKDDLSEWIMVRKKQWFLPIHDVDTQEKYIEIANYVESCGRFERTAVADFLDKADSWIIAKALSLHCAVVTHEISDPKCRRRIKIPDICNKFNVNYTNTINLLRDRNAKF